MGNGTSYVHVHASRGTIRVTLSSVVANVEAADNPGCRGPRPVQSADATGPPSTPRLNHPGRARHRRRTWRARPRPDQTCPRDTACRGRLHSHQLMNRASHVISVPQQASRA
jgi:hypothetical protein